MKILKNISLFLIITAMVGIVIIKGDWLSLIITLGFFLIYVEIKEVK